MPAEVESALSASGSVLKQKVDSWYPSSPVVDIEAGSSSSAPEDHPEERSETAVASAVSNMGDANINPTFVDYVALPEVRVRPPVKYKLWFLVWVMVYSGSTLASEANLYQALRLRGWLSPNASLFCMLSIIVFIMVYAGLDLVVEIGTFRYKKKVYGLEAWLRAGRAKWMYHYSEANFPVQLLATLVWKLEDGFAMFDAAPRKSPRSIQIQGQRQRHRQQPHQLRFASNLTTTTSEPSESDSLDVELDDASMDVLDMGTFYCDDEDCKVCLKIEHRIDPTKIREYRKWLQRIELAVRHQSGLIDVTNIEMRCGRDTNDTNDREQKQDPHQSELDSNDVEMGQGSSTMDLTEPSLCLHTIYCTFRNIGYLNEWLLSPRRKILMKQLAPLLAKPDIVQIQKDLILPDAFTSLIVAQGQCAPPRPPKKWKVWWLTSLALFVTIRWSRSFMPYYYEFWGLTNSHLQSLVGTAVSTWLNSYVMVPLMLFLFNPWMQRHPDQPDPAHEPWKTLDNGIQSIWIKAFLTFLFYGGCAIAWIVQSQLT